MKTLLLITTIGLLALTTNAQEHNIPKQEKDQHKTEMQQGDQQKAKKDNTRKMSRSKKEEANRKMDNYPSNKQSGGNPAEQRHMDSTINNHR